MKRILPFLLIISVLSGCTSIQTRQGVTEQEATTALLDVLVLSAHTIESNIYDQYSLSSLLPIEAQTFPVYSQIPRFIEHLNTWETQVKQAFRSVMIEMPSIVENASTDLLFSDPINLISASHSSATEAFTEQKGQVLEEQVRSLLATALEPSEATWTLIKDRYNLWMEANKIWGATDYNQIEIDPLPSLQELFLTTYRNQLASTEATLRTTPVPRGTGSSLEIFQQGQ